MASVSEQRHPGLANAYSLVVNVIMVFCRTYFCSFLQPLVVCSIVLETSSEKLGLSGCEIT